jgi:hypothetical protein
MNVSTATWRSSRSAWKSPDHTKRPPSAVAPHPSPPPQAALLNYPPRPAISVWGGARTRDQRISAPQFTVVADSSRIGLSTNRLRCSLDTHGCH